MEEVAENDDSCMEHFPRPRGLGEGKAGPGTREGDQVRRRRRRLALSIRFTLAKRLRAGGISGRIGTRGDEQDVEGETRKFVAAARRKSKKIWLLPITADSPTLVPTTAH